MLGAEFGKKTMVVLVCETNCMTRRGRMAYLCLLFLLLRPFHLGIKMQLAPYIADLIIGAVLGNNDLHNRIWRFRYCFLDPMTP